jgi:hypothetical protein
LVQPESRSPAGLEGAHCMPEWSMGHCVRPLLSSGDDITPAVCDEMYYRDQTQARAVWIE